MTNEMRDRLLHLIHEAEEKFTDRPVLDIEEFVADYLIENGVIVPPCRCKDCDHFINYKSGGTYCEEHSDGWGDNIVYVDEDDYCSFGIRKKEGADNG